MKILLILFLGSAIVLWPSFKTSISAVGKADQINYALRKLRPDII